MKLEEMVGKRMTEAQFDEAAGEKDACYRKVKARYDVWPSAYASGALVKCRKVGAANWGNSKKEVAEGTTQKFKSVVIDKAVKIAKSMGGNMTAAVKKIEKIEKNLSKNGRVEYALQQANESVNEAIEPSGIMAKISKIVQDKQAMKISGVLMDMFSAGMMMRIYNAVNDKSKEQMNKGTMRQVQVILHKVMKQNKVTK